MRSSQDLDQEKQKEEEETDPITRLVMQTRDRNA